MLNKITAMLLLIILIPLLFLIGLLVFIQTLEYPIFIQERGLTLTKHRFRIYKFRTIQGKQSVRVTGKILRNQEAIRSVLPLGRFLRKTGLDELPQLINVLKGEMNFVGPRPLDLIDLENIKSCFNEYYLEREKIEMLPGITGYWQVYKDRERSVENLIALDTYYKVNKSIPLTLKILAASFYMTLKGQNEVQNTNTLPYRNNIISKALSILNSKTG